MQCANEILSYITLRSTIECLMAHITIEHDVILLHNDIDFIKAFTASLLSKFLNLKF